MPKPNSPASDDAREIESQLRRMTRRGLVIGGTSILGGVGAWGWLNSRTQDGMLGWPLRRVLELNQQAAMATFDPARKSREYPESLAKMPKLNSDYGVNVNLDPAAYRLKVEGPAGSKTLTLADVKALPRVSVTTELRCVEGWSEIVTWGGARLVDLASATGLSRRSGKAGDPLADRDDLLPYVAMTTPDSVYYVGLDAPSAFHPQTLLCYEMNGEPLQKHRGAPLRLAIPLKYGIKSLKQIGTIRFTDTRPADYWAVRRYDWYAGF